MDLNDANLVKSLECPVCLDFFDEPKNLVCGHTFCQKCVNVVAARQTGAHADRNCIKCPECQEETKIPPGGLKTNYRLADLVCRAQKQLVDACACSDCGRQATAGDMYTCETCQETLNTKPLWICAVCAMEKHRDHTTPKCNKATRQQIQDACQGITNNGSVAEMYIGITMSHLNGALEKTEFIAQMLKKRRRGFCVIEKRVKRADENLTQEDLAASLETATDLKQKFEKSLSFRKSLLTSINDNIIHATLTNLDLSHNQISAIRGLGMLVNLEILDISFNRLRKIEGLTNLVKLKYIYLEHNMIKKIEGLDTLVNLELLDLDDNLITAIENLDNQHKLRELYLDNNLIMRLENLNALVNLKELHVAEQGIETFAGIQNLNKLKLIDAAKNSIASLDHLDHLQQLEDLCLNHNKITQWPEVHKLAKLAKLKHVWLGGNPIETQDGDNYLRNVIMSLRQVTRVDGTSCC